MKCPVCRSQMTSRKGNHRYAECGLPNVVLVDLEIRECPKCGERAPVIPNIEDLHRTLAVSVVQEPGRLTPQEIRFLRKWLGWSSADFAEQMGVDPATVSRWESVERPQTMSTAAERLLRLRVAYGQQVDSYPEALALLDKQARASAKLLGMRLASGKKSWEETPVAV